MKVALVYTDTTREMAAAIESALKANLHGREVEFATYMNPAILQEARDNGGLTAHCARMQLDLYERGAKDGADILFNICSSVGEVARLAKPLYELCGIGFVRIDEDMAMTAVRNADRIGVVATLSTTLNPTKALIMECAERQGKKVTLFDALADGAFGLDSVRFTQKLIETAKRVADQVDIIVLAQASMAFSEKDISAAVGKPVYSSIRFGAVAVAERLTRM